MRDISIYLADFKAKNLLKVCRLTDEKQIKGPASAEIGHNDCIDGHRGEELPPGGLKFLWKHVTITINWTYNIFFRVLQFKRY